MRLELHKFRIQEIFSFEYILPYMTVFATHLVARLPQFANYIKIMDNSFSVDIRPMALSIFLRKMKYNMSIFEKNNFYPMENPIDRIFFNNNNTHLNKKVIVTRQHIFWYAWE